MLLLLSEIGFIGLFWTICDFYPPWPPVATVQMHALKIYRKDIEALAAGESLNRSLSFANLGIRGFHVWAGGFDLNSTEWQIHVFAPHLPRLRYVFLPIGFDTFYYNFNYTHREHPDYAFYYSLYPYSTPIDGNWLYFLKSLFVQPLARVDHLENVWRLAKVELPVLFRNESYESVLKEFGTTRWGDPLRNSSSPSEEIMTGEITEEMPNLNSENLRIILNHPEAETQNYATLDRIAKYLNARGVRLVLYTPPAYELENALLDPKIISLNKEIMAKFTSEHPGLKYYDYRESEISHHIELFADPLHLNKKGAELFSDRFKADLF